MGRVGLNVVNGIENESAILRKNLATLQDFRPNLSGRAKRERLLRIDAATPKTPVDRRIFLSVAGDPFRRPNIAPD